LKKASSFHPGNRMPDLNVWISQKPKDLNYVLKAIMM